MKISPTGETLARILRRQGTALPLPCGGGGRCGKCRIRFLSGAPQPQEGERALLSPEELAAGWRLACLCRPEQDCTIVFPEEEDFSVLTRFDWEREKSPQNETVLAIDIGTTTLAFCRAQGGEIVKTYSAVNPQRAYGADVISRIQTSIQGEGPALRTLICRALAEGFRAVGEGAERIGITGNTAMLHLLRGYSCRGLGSFPFFPVTLARESGTLSGLLDDSSLPAVPTELLPGCSAFVGADIAAGLLAADFDRLTAPAFFLDLGTNGEMALWTGREILTASAPAGPAFEGGGISCGTGSVPGAICGAKLGEGRLSLSTIGGVAPVGLCGTGVVELTHALLRGGILDGRGTLSSPYDRTGFPLAKSGEGKLLTFTQEDVRQVQLAKAAVRAGTETLLARAGIQPEQVQTVFLAGGFGRALAEEAALGIGLLPSAFRGKLRLLGNAALGGTLRFLTEEDAPARLDSIMAQRKESPLAGSEDFDALYLAHLVFHQA